MNDLPREQLKHIINEYGRSLCDDPKRCKALLRDFCGQYHKEINVIIGALKERVPADLLNSQNSVPSDLLSARLTKRLEDRLGINPDAAKWAVEAWEFAVGLNLPATSESTEGIGDLEENNLVTTNLEENDLKAANSQAARTTRLKEANRKIKTAWTTGCFYRILI